MNYSKDGITVAPMLDYAPEKVREVSRKNPGYLQSSPSLLSDRERPDPGGVGDVADYKGPRTRSGS